MRFVLGPIPQDTDFHPDEDGWYICRELNPKLAAWIIGPFVASIVMLVLCIVILVFTEIRPDGFSLLGFLACYFFVIVAHEAIHAVCQPDRGLSGKSIYGFWPSRGICFTHFEGSRSRANFLVGIIAPFIILTVLPLMLTVIFGWRSWVVGVIIIWNGLSSALDLVGFGNVLASIPRNAKVRNLGWRTYWMPENQGSNS
ncbi:MAG: DUF3267 domain-containing protein [Cellvibrionaceae bacterium]|nr:DUF3267 domain-containing protein [Cellvibrionaceae bacterium]